MAQRLHRRSCHNLKALRGVSPNVLAMELAASDARSIGSHEGDAKLTLYKTEFNRRIVTAAMLRLRNSTNNRTCIKTNLL